MRGDKHQLPHLPTLLNANDHTPLTMIAVKSEFNDLLFLIDISEPQTHPGQVLYKLGYAKAVCHAMLLPSVAKQYFLTTPLKRVYHIREFGPPRTWPPTREATTCLGFVALPCGGQVRVH